MSSRSCNTFGFAGYIGIDPGAHGALAAFNGVSWRVEDLPHGEDGLVDSVRLAELLVSCMPCAFGLIAIERPLPFFVRNADSVMKLGQSYGAIVATARLVVEQHRGWELRTPTAKKWKHDAGLSSEKARSVEVARAELGLSERARLRHDKAEAVLLACWARDHWPGADA